MQENILFEYLTIPSVTTDVIDLAVDVTNQGIIWWTKTISVWKWSLLDPSVWRKKCAITKYLQAQAGLSLDRWYPGINLNRYGLFHFT